MSMTHEEAFDLKQGDKLQFGDNPAVYDVVEVQMRSGKPYLVLRREDGYDTFADHHALDVATGYIEPQSGGEPEQSLPPGLAVEGVPAEDDAPGDESSSDLPDEPQTSRRKRKDSGL